MFKKIENTLITLSKVHEFIMQFFRELLIPPYEFKEFVRQCYEIGVKSLPLISLTGFIIGIVFTNQSRPSLEDFGATSMLPSAIAIAIVRALAPLVTALIASGKVGSNIGAELGSMRVTEQIDAMEVSGINPFKYLVVTRVLACTLMIPVLSCYTGFVGLIGSGLNVYQHEQVSFISFFDQVFNTISFLDINQALVKAAIFGFTIGVVGCYQGYNSMKGTEGVGKAANAAVVLSMFLIFIEEQLVVMVVQSIRG
ncbi:MlaE family ABC transporter permease [Olivibacter sitiensis]|uniref:MlaE family ABC transporter permease n=1 Tax=Olivibacter sitiensis TaxID=376470 RepID=UPI00041C570B|nr:ABC transporter permease [Olivibacter sitiensis]